MERLWNIGLWIIFWGLCISMNQYIYAKKYSDPMKIQACVQAHTTIQYYREKIGANHHIKIRDFEKVENATSSALHLY